MSAIRNPYIRTEQSFCLILKIFVQKYLGRGGGGGGKQKGEE